MSFFRESPRKNPDGEDIWRSLIDTQGTNLKEYLESQLEKYNLVEKYKENQIGALGIIYTFELFRQRSRVEGRVLIYYPGIGGGDQSFDILGAFLSTNADEVYGVDLLDGREDIRDFHEVAKFTMKGLPENGNMSLTETDDEWVLEFDLFEKRRRLRVSKHPTNVHINGKKGTTYISPDPAIGPLVYSRGTATLLNYMAPEMNQRVQALMIRDDNDYTPQQVQDFWTKEQGLVNIDFQSFSDLMERKYSLSGYFSPSNKRLLVRK